MPPAQNVQVQVVHGLPAVFADVDDDPEAVFGQAQGPGDVDGGLHELAEQEGVVGCRVQQIDKRLFGDDQNVRRGLRGHVSEGEYLIVFVDDVGGDLAPEDLVENRVRHLGRLQMAEGVAARQDVG